MKILKLTTIVLALGGLIACESSTKVSPETTDQPDLNVIQNNESNASSMSMGSSEKNKGLATLRRATARYHDVSAAIDDGFDTIFPCQENPEGDGGLGIPYINMDRVLDGKIDLENPDVLFYEPQKNGKLRLVGAEPVIPIELWTEEGRPSLFGIEFHRNEQEGLFGLHMWIWKHNPDGVFAFWHSGVSCEHAD